MSFSVSEFAGFQKALAECPAKNASFLFPRAPLLRQQQQQEDLKTSVCGNF